MALRGSAKLSYIKKANDKWLSTPYKPQIGNSKNFPTLGYLSKKARQKYKIQNHG